MNKKLKPIVYHVHDPMCSWCWGYRPTWDVLQTKLESIAQVHSLVGGLAEDSNVPMPENMQNFLQQTWRKISAELGTKFNFDFWSQCQPKRSTYPACRAIIIARNHLKENEMCLAIQEAYYLFAQNPSEVSTLVTLADSIGLDGQLFEAQIRSDKVNQQLMSEIMKVRTLPIQGFPSLVLSVGGELFPIRLDYKNWQTSYDIIVSILEKFDSNQEK